MKKGVVLILTLFFITAISALILKNLSDTDIFLEEQNYIMNNTQAMIAVKNTKDEIAKLIIKYKDSIDETLENELLQENIPIKIEDLNISFNLKKYEKIDINEIKAKDSKEVKNKFIEFGIPDYDIFKEIYLEKVPTKDSKVENSKQLDDIINTHIFKSYSDDILKIRDEIGFKKSEDLYELNLNIKYNYSEVIAYYLLKNDGVVEYFDISFK